MALIQDISCSSSSEPSRSPHLGIYVLGGYLQSRTGPMCPRLRHVERYNITADCWEPVADLHTDASVIQTFNVAGKLITSSWQYCHTDISRLDKSEQSLFEYNPCRNKWEPYNGASPEVINHLHRCATNQGAVTYCEKHHHLYIVDSDAVSCVKVDISNGDVKMQTVISYPLMPSFQDDTYVNIAATVLDGSLFVLGGTLVVSELEKFSKKDVWMFDEGNHCWVQKNGMLNPRAAFCAVTLNSAIYAMGGFNQKRMKSVERYDMHSDTWCEVSTMNKERTHAAAVVAGDKIYIFGGKSYSDSYACGGARKVLKTCEVYDPVEDRWSFIKPMSKARCMCGIAVV